MPTDTQRAPTLMQCIEREREATEQLAMERSRGEPIHIKPAREEYNAARAATDDAVRDLTRWTHELIDTADSMADRLALPQAVQDELDSITLAIARVLPRATDTGGVSDE